MAAASDPALAAAGQPGECAGGKAAVPPLQDLHPRGLEQPGDP